MRRKNGWVRAAGMICRQRLAITQVECRDERFVPTRQGDRRRHKPKAALIRRGFLLAKRRPVHVLPLVSAG
jgi:hypothetical protein